MRFRECDILSDSRSSLDAIADPHSTHPLVNDIRDELSKVAEKGGNVKFWWVRAHIGTVGNERADELAKQAALYKKSAAHYDRFPLSFARRTIRQRTLEAWQEEYAASPRGKITKLFFPDVRQTFKTITRLGVSYWTSQAWTGHGGLASYLHRFGLRDDPGCACSPDAEQTVEHVLNECPMFAVGRLSLESEFNTKITTSTWSTLLANDRSGQKFAAFCTSVVKAVTNLNKNQQD